MDFGLNFGVFIFFKYKRFSTRDLNFRAPLQLRRLTLDMVGAITTLSVPPSPPFEESTSK